MHYKCLLKASSVIVTATLLAANIATASPSVFPKAEKFEDRSKVSVSPEKAKGLKYYFIRYQGTPVAEAVALKTLQGSSLSKKEQLELAKKLQEEQDKQREIVEASGAKIITATRVGSYGFIVLANPQQFSQLKSLPGVADVSGVELHTQNHASSVPWIGTKAFQERTGITGEGIRVAVIDSGIDYLHASMGGSGDPDEYSNNDTSLIEPGSFPTSKVIGGWDFAGPTYDARDRDSVPQPDPDPLDVGGHGSHVAGSVAATAGSELVAPGVAPGAKLYAYKVFSDQGGSTALSAAAIERSLDPNGDGSIDDKVDVINLSLGALFGSPNDPSAIAAQNAVDNGVVLTISAGNSGDLPYVLGSPSVAPGAISVANSFAGNRLQMGMQVDSNEAPEVNGLYPVVEGTSAVRVEEAVITGPITVASPLMACSPLTNTISGIALVSRGACSFKAKFINAQNAGASAIVVYNDGANPGRILPITMGGVGADATIPGVMVSFTVGDAINKALSAGASATGVLDASILVPAIPGPDIMSNSSSRGPGQGGSTFKPSVTAPGSDITSISVGTGNGGVSFNGTSMAAPHVAGVSALLLQMNPDLPPDAVKSLIMNSAVPMYSDGPGGTQPYPLSRQGTGRVDVDAASQLTSYTTPAGLSFGRINLDHQDKVVRKVRVHNMSSEEKTYTISHVPAHGMEGVVVSAAQSIVVAPNNSNEFEIVLDMDPGKAPQDPFSFSHSEVDGWVVLNDGNQSLRVGYLAVVDPASAIKAEKTANGEITLTNHGPAAGPAFGFTQAEKLGRMDEGAYGIEAVGYRVDDEVIEIAVATKHAWETPSTMDFNFYIDLDGDGEDDVRLRGMDQRLFDFGEDEPGLPPGRIITAQYDIQAGTSFPDNIVRAGDYNDSTIVLSFTREVAEGLAPDAFDFRLELISREAGVDTFYGNIDIAKEVVGEQLNLNLEPGASTTVKVAGDNEYMLWLMPNNPVSSQHMEAEVK